MNSSDTPYTTLKHQIKERSYAAVPFPISKAEFQTAMDVFIRFLALPAEVKQSIYFKIRPEDRGSEVGYKRYLRDEGQTDNREYFHYNKAAEKEFATLRQDIPDLDVLLKTMKGIHDEALASLQEIIKAFDEPFPGIYERFFSEKQPGNFYLRFLKYDRATAGEFLAKGHYDRGSCTLALAESAPGLRMGPDDLNLKEISHQEGEALFMPGLKFPQVTSEEFVPTWHDVIQKSNDAYSDTIARWAIVLFADTWDIPLITYEEAHTPKRITAS